MTNLHRPKTLLIAGIVAQIPRYRQPMQKRNLKSSPRLPLLPTWRKRGGRRSGSQLRLPKPGAEIHESISQRPAILTSAGAAYRVNGSEPRAMVRPLLSAPSGVPSSSPPVSNRWALPKARITVKPNPHARCRQKTRWIYVDNISRRPSVKYDPDNAQIYKQNAERYKAKFARDGRSVACRTGTSPISALAGHQCEGAFSYGRAIIRHESFCISGQLTPINRDAKTGA